MYRFFLSDDRGVVTTDWVALTAGIVLLGIVAVYAVMNDSAAYLLDEFDSLNQQYEQSAIQVSNAIEQSKLQP